jgi:hypothetical protein
MNTFIPKTGYTIRQKTKKEIILQSKKPILTIGAAKKAASTNIEWFNVLSELVDNAILVDKSKCITVTMNLHYNEDNEKSYIEVIDDSIGIPEKDILNVFDYGQSSNHGKMLLCKMGMGLKGAIWGLGEFDYLVTKTVNGNKCQAKPAKYDSDSDILEYVQVNPTTSELDAQSSGTVVKIKRVNDKLPNWTSKAHFDKFVDNFNSMYANLLYENRVKIIISYSNSLGIKWYKECSGSFPLMSNPRHLLNNDISIGFNEPTYIKDTTTPIDGVEIKTKNTKVKLTAWHKPTPNQVEKYYDSSKNETYNPEKYKQSLFGYGSDTGGYTIMYKGKYIEFGVEKNASRTENQGIILEIQDDSGLSFTGYKNTLQKNNNYKEMLEAVDAYLKQNGFFVRSIVGTPSVEEDEIVKKFLEYIQKDAIYLESFGIENYQKQVETWIRTEVGETDIIIRNYENPEIVTCVIEAKKDRCGGYEAAQLWGYMAYHKCKKGILLSGADEQPSLNAMIKSLKDFCNLPEVEIQKMNVKTLKAGKFFNI